MQHVPNTAACTCYQAQCRVGIARAIQFKDSEKWNCNGHSGTHKNESSIIKIYTTMFENLSLNAACKEQHEAVIEKGFTPQPVATNLMLIVSELGEACEADRKNRHANFRFYEETMKPYNPESPSDMRFKDAFELCIKDSFEDEIADAFLRLMDLCGAMNIDIEKHIRMKAEYNKLRPTKHGKAY